MRIAVHVLVLLRKCKWEKRGGVKKDGKGIRGRGKTGEEGKGVRKGMEREEEKTYFQPTK